MALFDFDRLYLAIQEYKLQRSWHNLHLEHSRLMDFCLYQYDWYTLTIPEAELLINSITDIQKQEAILIRLLQDYTDRFYKSLKMAYEGQFYEAVTVKADDESLVKNYHFEIENSDTGEAYKAKIEELKKWVKTANLNKPNQWKMGQMAAISFDSSLYYPWLALIGIYTILINLYKTMSYKTNQKQVFLLKSNTCEFCVDTNGLALGDDVPLKMRPLEFSAKSEVDFVRDLEAFYHSPSGQAMIGKRSLYLLRNADNKFC